MNFESWVAYISVVIVAVVMPGPATLLAATHSIRHGAPKSLATIFGILSGVVLVSTLSVLGVGSIAYFSGLAFSAIKVIGALYLILLGILLWKKGFGPVKNIEDEEIYDIAGMYRQGFLVAITSPKTLTVSTAIFPQFVDPSLSLAPQFLVLISTFVILTSFYLIFTVCIANHAFSNLGGNTSRILGRVAGGVMAGAGVALLVSTGRAA